MGGRIAVVDDDPVFLDLLRALLSEEGYEPHLFRDGLEAYPRIRALAPRAIILDVCMEGDPTASWRLLTRAWDDPVLRDAPIIVCSGDPSLRERTGDLEAHGCAVLAKPFDVDALLDLLARFIDHATPTGQAYGRGAGDTPVDSPRNGS